MDNKVCDICGRPASVHMTEIRDGQKVERHLCAEHADVSALQGLAPGQMLVNGVVCSTVEEATTRGILDNLRSTSNFARRHGRMPATVEELQEGMSLPDDVAGVEIADPELRAQLKWVDGLIALCRVHGRMPQTLDEMPPGRRVRCLLIETSRRCGEDTTKRRSDPGDTHRHRAARP